MDASEDIRMIDLGEAHIIDSLATAFRGEMDDFDIYSGERQKKESIQRSQHLLKQLHALIWKPLDLPDGSKVLVAPDAKLHALAFDALIDAEGKYLIDTHQISYVDVGREVLNFKYNQHSQGRSPIIFANPAFDLLATATESPDDQNRARSLIGARFEDLPGTGLEAAGIQELYDIPDNQVFRREQATETALMSLNSPKRLHIATHAFFLEDPEAISAFTDKKPAMQQTAADSPDPDSVPVDNWENPLLRSGFVLAGVNQSLAGTPINSKNDGVVTTMELASLNLKETDLVVLSACDTGTGVLKAREGVYGLRRVLKIAGAQSVVMSLWQVADQSTADLMVDFYRRMDEGENKKEALRSAAIALRSKPGYEHPYFWAPFILSGNPD